MKSLLEGLTPPSLAVVRSIGALAEQKGMKAYLVGGPVRDLRLRLPVIDLDITVEGRGIDLARAYAQHTNGKLTTYPAFGTATVQLPSGKCVDIVTARKEVYVRPGAFPKVTFAKVRDDLFRRDFTVNAMAVSINPKTWGTLVDPFGGMEDMLGKKVRVLHKGSFIDDPTRILRAARFKARLGFSMERQTLQWLKEAVTSGALGTITPARYMKEYNKILKENKPAGALELLAAWGAGKER